MLLQNYTFRTILLEPDHFFKMYEKFRRLQLNIVIHYFVCKIRNEYFATLTHAYCATNRKVAVSIPDVVTGIFI
jgi:hypothetical protein